MVDFKWFVEGGPRSIPTLASKSKLLVEVKLRVWPANCVWKMGETKSGNTKKRRDTATKDKAFDQIRALALIKTQAEHLLDVMHKGTVSTNVFLRRIHNFALDMNWIPRSIIPKRQWPAVQFKDKHWFYRRFCWEESYIGKCILCMCGTGKSCRYAGTVCPSCA